MDDLISRKAAIERIEKQKYREPSIGVWKQNDRVALACYDTVIEALKRLPSAEPHWIPVVERLPKCSDLVLISACGLEIDIGSYYCDKWHINGCGPVEDGIVIAWMPLPKPYKRTDMRESE